MDFPMEISSLNAAQLKKRLLSRVPELSQVAQCDVDVILNRDSAHLGPDEWALLAKHIQMRHKNYDGFVILHGTDTLAYTASALSFLLSPCVKPVVLTGAQRPLSALRSDARQNLISAVEFATHSEEPLLQQVTVFFDDRLLQGNRVRKRSALEFSAFESPQSAPLAYVGTTIRFRETPKTKPLKIKSKLKFLQPLFNRNVPVLHVTPGFPSLLVRENVLPGADGLVLVVFPSGTAPTHDPEFLALLKHAHTLHIPVVVTTEGASASTNGGIDPMAYEAGRELLKQGCLWAGEMTPECAFVKTSLLLGQPGGRENFSKLFHQNFAEEGASIEPSKRLKNTVT